MKTLYLQEPNQYQVIPIYMFKRHKSPEKELEELISSCAAGDRRAQNELFKSFSARMMNVCMRYSRSREEAEDTLVEGFMKVFDHIKEFRKEGSLEGWIRKIMVNSAVEKFRKKNMLYASLHIDDIPEQDFSGSDVLSDMSADELMVLIQNLPAGYRMVFNLYAFEGLKHKEIAEKLGISEGTSKSNLFDARSILKKEVELSRRQAKASNE
jgi:RNA polymerase sigma factor (sigma-70 family)